MDSNDTLINEYEVIEYSNAAPNSFAGSRRNSIITAEEKLFLNQKCLGIDFYKELLANRQKYSISSSINSIQYVIFREGIVYQIGGYVLYTNKIYKCILTTTGGEFPSNQMYFKEASRFKNENYEFLWQRYLKRIIAASVNVLTMPSRLFQDTPSGLIKNQSDGLNNSAISIKELQVTAKEINQSIDTDIALMTEYLKQNSSFFPKLKTTCENSCTKEKKNAGFLF